MDARLVLSYFLIMLILPFTLFWALLPLQEDLRYPAGRTVVIAGSVLFAIIVVCSLIGAATSFEFKWIVILGLVGVLALYLPLLTTELPKKLFCFFNATLIAGYSIVYGAILAAPLEKDDSFITLEPVSCLVCLGVALVLSALFYTTLAKKIPYLLNSEHLNLNYAYAVAITLGISALFFWVIPRVASLVLAGRVRITILGFLLLAPGAFLLLYHTIWRVAYNLTENANLRETNELMAMEQKRYHELRSYMDETRNLRHDFRQHLLVIDEYAKQGEMEKLTEYVGQFTKSLQEHRPVLAANPALDAVASHYASVAEAQDTKIAWHIELPSELPVRETDVITIFGNLVENALIAVAEIPEQQREVVVTAKMLSDAMLGITVVNPYEGTITMDKTGLPITDRAEHGVGLQSVQSVVKRYHGSLDIQTDNNIFSIGVLLYCL